MEDNKKILAYQISGQTCGIDIVTWYTKDLDGNEPFIIIHDSESIPSGYIDISSIENWVNFGLNVANDYSVAKFAIKNIAETVGWSGLTNTEKDISIEYYSYPDPTSAVIYLMAERKMSQLDASKFVTLQWHKHHLKNIVAYRERWNYAKLVVVSFISRTDAEDLFNTVKPLIDLYIEVGILGVDFNDSQNGIYDYMYSLYDFTDNGLEENDYTLLQGTWDDFKTGLCDVLVWGDYTKYN